MTVLIIVLVALLAITIFRYYRQKMYLNVLNQDQWIEGYRKAQLIDVREPNEHSQGNIGGRLVPLGKIQTMQVEDIEDLKDQEVIVYCRSGRRSMMACAVLDQIGFKDTSNLEGGYLAWQEKYGA